MFMAINIVVDGSRYQHSSERRSFVVDQNSFIINTVDVSGLLAFQCTTKLKEVSGNPINRFGNCRIFDGDAYLVPHSP